MKKIICVIIAIISLTQPIFAVYLDNSWDIFKDQPCYGLDNENPSGHFHIIYSPKINKQTPISGEISIENNLEQKKINIPTMQTIKCRIHMVTFYTNLYHYNYVVINGKVYIKYHYTQDGHDYYLKYDEKEKIYRPYEYYEME